MHEPRLFFRVTIWMAVLLHLPMRGVASGQTAEAKLQALSQAESVEILKTLSLQIKGNSEKVYTWEGEVEFVFDNYARGERAVSLLKQRGFRKPKETGTPQTVKGRKTGTITFVLDKSKKSHYEKVTRTQPIRYSDGNGVELGAESGPYEAVSIITPESYMGSLALVLDGRVAANSVTVEGVADDTMTKKGIYDPQTHLKLGMPIWEYLDRVRGLFEKNGRPQIGGRPLEVQPHVRNGKTEFKILSPYMQGSLGDGGKPVGYMHLCFSADAEFNLVSMELTDVQGNVGQRVEWDYAKLGDVVVPREMRRRNYTPGGEVSYEATYVFRNQKINHVLKPGTFTYKNMGLVDGDLVVDKILNKKFRYEATTQTFKVASE